jgi:hypothetical protein
MTIASGGAGDITLGTAVDGYQTFADAGVSDANVVRYTIEDGDDWEIGTGVYTASGTTLVRTVTESSNSDAALTCSADAVIFVTLAAEDFSGNAAPIWTTTPPSNLSLANDGSTAVTLAGVAIDEFPIQYSWDGYSGTSVYNDSNLPPQLASAPTLTGGTASLVGSSTSSNAGAFNFRLKASDGVKTAAAITAVTLDFFPQPSNLVARHEIADISGSTWSDSSGNSVDLTIAGTGSSGGYNSSGDLGEPVLELAGGSGGKYLSYGTGDLSTAKTFVIIFQPTNTSSSNMVISSGSNTWNGLSKSGDSTSPTSLPAWSGTSASVILNGAAMASRDTLYNGYVGNKFNSVASRNYDFGTRAYVIQGYTNNIYNPGMAVKAIYAWSVALTDAELQSVHNMQSQMVTWST